MTVVSANVKNWVETYEHFLTIPITNGGYTDLKISD